VVFRCEPENGDVGMPGYGGLSRAGEGGSGFERGVEGSAKEADLLSGENGGCVGAERCDGGSGGRGGVLRGQQIYDFVPVIRARTSVPPCGFAG